MNRVYIEPAWKLPLSYSNLIANPPSGYEFISTTRFEDAFVKRLAKRGSNYWLRGWLCQQGIPIDLLMAYVRRFRHAPPDADLTLAVTHMVLRPEPWVLDIQAELPAILVGPEWHFQKYRSLVANVLLAAHCRRILAHVEAAKRALVQSLGREQLHDKVQVVYPAVPKKEFVKRFCKSRVRILFVGSANIPGQFEYKGGKEALEAFVILRQRYHNVELVVRSDVPTSIRAQFDGTPGLEFIDRVLTGRELEMEFQRADIFLLPSHFTPSMVFIEAMSYELPVVTLDVWGSRELVEDGRTGFVVPKSRLAPEFDPGAPWGHSRRFPEVLARVDPMVVQNLVHCTCFLIENREFCQRMGRIARWEVESGRFSLRKRDEALQRVLDEAISKH